MTTRKRLQKIRVTVRLVDIRYFFLLRTPRVLTANDITEVNGMNRFGSFIIDLFLRSTAGYSPNYSMRIAVSLARL
jgi:hypothetical protein